MLTGQFIIPVLSVHCVREFNFSKTDAFDLKVKSWKNSSTLNIAAV